MDPSNIKLLAIDNQSKVSDLDRKRYKSMGVHSSVVGTFAEAQEKLDSGSFDMILINYDDESLNAAALTEHYKDSQASRKMPIVVTTVQSAEAAAKALKGKADLIIEFPIPGQQFVEKLRGLLDQKTRQHQRINQSFSATISVAERSESKRPLKAVSDKPFEQKLSRILATVEDISSTGILLGLDNEIPVGENIEVQLQLPGYKKPFVANGKVVRQVQLTDEGAKPQAVGVKFHGFRGDSEKRLKNYLTKQQIISSKISYYL